MGLKIYNDQERHPKLYLIKNGLQLTAMVGVVGSFLTIGALCEEGYAYLHNPFNDKGKNNPPSLENRINHTALSAQEIYDRQQEKNMLYTLILGVGLYVGAQASWKASKRIEGHITSTRQPEPQRKCLSKVYSLNQSSTPSTSSPAH